MNCIGIESVHRRFGRRRADRSTALPTIWSAVSATTVSTVAHGDDLLDGGAGNDVIDGGAGFDTLDLSAATGPVSVDFGAGKVSGAGIGSDSFVNVENLLFGAGDDVVSGGNADDGFDGGAGNDTLKGGAGNDTLRGRRGQRRARRRLG